MTRDAVQSVDLNTEYTEFTIGGKAENLSQLSRAGLPVPEGVVIPAETPDSHVGVLAEAIAERFAGLELAVRSSGAAEDLTSASFAGQYETVLNVPARALALVEAARRVRASVSGTRVDGYAEAHSDAMAVLVMPMVDADTAGVAFTRDPVTGDRVVIIEAVKGIANRLVSGEQAGERWRIASAPECLNNLHVLSERDASAVAELALRCEQEMGSPQDIEWAIGSDGLVLLQSRPITTLDDVEPIPMEVEALVGTWEWDWTHSQLPMTPLTATIFTPSFAEASQNLAETYGIPISHIEMRLITGYVYISVVPLIGKPGQSVPPKPLFRLLFKLVPALRRRAAAARRVGTEETHRTLAEQWRTVVRPKTVSVLDAWYDVDVNSLSDEDLVEQFMDAAELQRETFRWNMITDPAYLIPLADLYDFVMAEFDGDMAMATRLVAGASPSEYHASAESLRDSMPESVRTALVGREGVRVLDDNSRQAFEDHQRGHSDRVIGFDLSYPTHREDADKELSRIATMPTRRDPSIDAGALAATLGETLEGTLAARFGALLKEARNAYPIREDGESVHARVMGSVRRFALGIGDRMVAAGHLTDREHVVFVELEEVAEWFGEPRDFRDIVRIRRGQHLWARSHTPELRIGPEDPMPPLDAFPPDVKRIMRIVQILQTHDGMPPDLADGQDGVPASAGVYAGPARIVEGPADFEKIQLGDVLVAPMTMSPWEVLFPYVGALVTESGGLLSHTAIVAREYGLPAVVACEGAMTRFHDGQMISVDGTAGTVTPIDREP